jgi:hypothetical protein
MLLAVALGARITVAAPRTTVAELRAAVCCMQHCPEGVRPPMRPHRCCVVSSDATDPASLTAVTSLERPDAAPLVLLPPVTPVLARAILATRPAVVASRAGPPGFLETQKLRC